MCENKQLDRSGAATPPDVDPDETQEWLDSLEDALYRWGPERVAFLLKRLEERARLRAVDVPFQAQTPPVNTIPPEEEPAYPGDLELERKIEDLCRWNAVAMVVRANLENDGIGGHLATYASSAVLYEVGFNHFFRGRDAQGGGDQVYIQGHGSPGIYARAFLEGRLSEHQLLHFRQELVGGLPSYPHPWLFPDFWEFPTVSMGLAPLMAIYQARFNKYLCNRGLKDVSASRVWSFLGDGEMDEPESLGAIDIAVREKLDNLIVVVNCNLQRLDGPVRGNGSIVHELEGIYRGAGWRVIKVLWNSAWDELFAKDEEGHLAAELARTVDGELQRYAAEPPSYMREHLFGHSPELTRLIEGWSDEDLARLGRGGFDRRKVHAAYAKACERTGRPTVILAHTIKGYGLGKAVQGANSTHQAKKLKEDGILELRDRLDAPLSDEQARALAFARPSEQEAPELRYLRERREALGGFVPSRRESELRLDTPPLEFFGEFMGGSGGREASTTMSFVRMLALLLRDRELGKMVVPIIPDEARTFGMEAFFRQYGIYAPQGQLYEPVDKNTVLYYRECQDGQILEEGITEAGAMCSFIAAGTSYSTHELPLIPFFIYYSMFGFQRIGDFIWAAGDMRCRGFMLGATAGRTTLNGEGLQHEDGHSHLIAAAFPNVRAYDPAYAYEVAVLVQDGMRRMYHDREACIYYLTLQNENYAMPAMPEGEDVPEAIVRGMYRVRRGEGDGPRVQLFGSGSILREVLRGADLLAEKYGVTSDVWSVTSYKQLRTDALAAERWNRLHPGAEPQGCHLWRQLEGVKGPFVAASDNVRLVADQIAPWVPGRWLSLGTDGFGRSDTRARLRRHFEVDGESVAIAALSALAADGALEQAVVKRAIEELGVDPDQPDAQFA